MNDPFGKPSDEAQDPRDLSLTLPPPVIPPVGDYTVKITDYKQSISKSGNPMIVWDLAIADGPHQGHDIRTWTVTDGPGMFQFRNIGKALDLFGEDKITINKKYKEIVGRRMTVKCEHREYEGTTSLSVKKYMRHPDGPVGSSAQIFSSTVAPMPASPEEDDIPFPASPEEDDIPF